MELPQISEAEWQVMEVVWQGSPITAAEIIVELAEPTGWNHRTIRTLLNRLVRKKALSFETLANRYLYRPLVKRESYLKEEGRTFLQKMFSGDTASLVMHFVRDGRLSATELRELKQLLAQKQREAGK